MATTQLTSGTWTAIGSAAQGLTVQLGETTIAATSVSSDGTSTVVNRPGTTNVLVQFAASTPTSNEGFVITDKEMHKFTAVTSKTMYMKSLGNSNVYWEIQ